MLCIIAAVGCDRVIGRHNRLPWHLSADLKRFKALTTGHPVIMGRLTYQSIGKPLPHRHNIVISRNTTLVLPGCTVAHSLNDALTNAKQQATSTIFIIGGTQLYEQTLPIADCLYLTEVNQRTADGDAFFPLLNPSEWTIEREPQQSGPPPFCFTTYQRKR